MNRNSRRLPWRVQLLNHHLESLTLGARRGHEVGSWRRRVQELGCPRSAISRWAEAPAGGKNGRGLRHTTSSPLFRWTLVVVTVADIAIVIIVSVDAVVAGALSDNVIRSGKQFR
jgi:hypothetical protein